MLQLYGWWTLWLCSAGLLMLSLGNSHKEHCLSTAPGSASWFSFTLFFKACGVRKFSEQNGHWLTCILVCTLSLVIVLNSFLQSLYLITLSLCSPKCCKYSEYWLNGWVQNGQAKIVCSPGCSWLMCSVSFLPVWYTLPQYLHSTVSADSITFFFFAKAASTGFTALRYLPFFLPSCSRRCLS